MVQLVTVFGGSGFVGKQVVRALAKKGWRVRVAVRRPTIAYDLKPNGDVGQIQVVRCDVRKSDDIAAALHGADAVVNLVGILMQGGGQTFEGLHHKAAEAIAQAAAAKGVRAFVQMSAIGADPKSASAYAASKAAQIMFMRSMAKELAPNLRVNCVAPAWTETDMADASLTELGREEVAKDFPLGRIGLPEDVAGATLFLLSDLARFVTGTTVTVDGGMDMRG